MRARLDLLFAALLLSGLAAGAFLLGRPERLAGAVRVVDGDTVELGGRRLRLSGLDAPEIGQTCGEAGGAYPCGEAARDALRVLVGSGPVACAISGRDRYGRDLASCEAGGRDLGSALVRAGQAVAYGRYLEEEREARARKRGLWAGPFEPPARWRSAHRPN